MIFNMSISFLNLQIFRELSYKIALQQSFLPRSGLGIKPGVSNLRLCRVLSCPEGTPENLAFYQRELLFPSEFFLIDTD